ncbi:MAG: terminase [Georgenia sp.]
MSATAVATAPRVVMQPQPGSQALFLACPLPECLYEGTRGPGKTEALLMDFVQHVGAGYGSHWRGILFRRTYKQLADVIAKSKRWFWRVFPDAKWNKSDSAWVFPDGEELLLRYMRTPDDYWNYHGHEYPWIGFEELTNWPTLDCYHVMASCSRSSGPAAMPRKRRATCNPFGVGHQDVKLYFIDPAPPGVPIINAEGQARVRIFGHYSENLALLNADPDYEKRLLGDRNKERRKAWAAGRWDINAGGMFGDVWDERAHVLKPFAVPASWRIDRSYDHGSSKPFSVGWWAESDGTVAPNGVHYPKGTLFRIGEWYGWDGETPNVGVRMKASDIAAGIVEREKGLKIHGRVKPGPADSSIWTSEPGEPSVGDKLKAGGADFVPANKAPGSRKLGWEECRNRLSDVLDAYESRTPLETPGIFIFDNCRQCLRILPSVPRDERDPDDVDTDAEDHLPDEFRYRVMAPRREWRQGTASLTR